MVSASATHTVLAHSSFVTFFCFHSDSSSELYPKSVSAYDVLYNVTHHRT